MRPLFSVLALLLSAQALAAGGSKKTEVPSVPNLTVPVAPAVSNLGGGLGLDAKGAVVQVPSLPVPTSLAVPQVQAAARPGAAVQAQTPLVGGEKLQAEVTQAGQEAAAQSSGDSDQSRVFDAAAERKKGEDGGAVSAGQGGRGSSSGPRLDSPRTFYRAEAVKRYPQKRPGAKAVGERVTQLVALERRGTEFLEKRLGVSAGKSQEIWRDLFVQHPTVFNGYHTPEHSYQVPETFGQLVEKLERVTGDPRAVRRELQAIDEEVAAAQLDKLSAETGVRRAQSDLAAFEENAKLAAYASAMGEQGLAAERDRLTKAVTAARSGLVTVEDRIRGYGILRGLIEKPLEKEFTKLVLLGLLYHDVDPTRAEGTLARVPATLEFLDAPVGKRHMDRLIQESLGRKARKSDYDLIKAVVASTDFRYRQAEKDAVWPTFLDYAQKAFPNDQAARERLIALAPILRFADQMGSYGTPVHLKPGDDFIVGIVDGLSREFIASNASLGSPPMAADALKGGTHSFLRSRAPGTFFYDPNVFPGQFAYWKHLGEFFSRLGSVADMFEARFAPKPAPAK